MDMIEVDELLRNLQLLLSTRPEFADLHVVTAFPGGAKASPLVRPTVALGVDRLEEKDVEPVYAEPQQADEPPKLLYNHLFTLRLRFDVHVPQTGDGLLCYTIFNRVSRSLLDFETNVPVVGAGCGDLRYQRDAGAFTLHAYLDLRKTSTV